MTSDQDWWYILLSGIVLVPVSYFVYVYAILWFQGRPIRIEQFPELTLTVLLLAFLGGLMVEGWFRGFRALPLVAVGGTFVWPWIHLPSNPVDGASVMVLAVGVLVVGLLEAASRFPSQMRELVLSESGKLALVVGILHFLVGLLLQFYVSRFHFLLGVTDIGSFIVAFAVYTVCGLALVVIGALPIIFWYRARLVIPAVVASGWFAWGLYGIWRTRQRYPLSAFAGSDWLAFRPHPDYLLQWAVPLIAILVVASVEWWLRALLTGSSRHV
jgi:hypothetical protein